MGHLTSGMLHVAGPGRGKSIGRETSFVALRVSEGPPGEDLEELWWELLGPCVLVRQHPANLVHQPRDLLHLLVVDPSGRSYCVW